MTSKVLTALPMLLLATPALAGGQGGHDRPHGHHARPQAAATLLVDNGYVDTVRVSVDGHAVGTIRSGADGAFTVRPGRHDITVSTLDGHVLSSGTEWMTPRDVDRISVYNPMVSLTVKNTGVEPLYVAGVDGGRWVQPHQAKTVTVPAGKWELTASIRHRGRLLEVDCKSVYARPGHRNRTVFDYAPLPTRMILTNSEPKPVSVTMDGQSYGMLGSGQSFTLEVRPGAHSVAAFTRHGRVVFRGQVSATRAEDTRVDFYRPRPDRTYAHAGHRR